MIINYNIQGEANRKMYDWIGIKEDGTMKLPIMNEVQTRGYLDQYLGVNLRTG